MATEPTSLPNSFITIIELVSFWKLKIAYLSLQERSLIIIIKNKQRKIQLLFSFKVVGAASVSVDFFIFFFITC